MSKSNKKAPAILILLLVFLTTFSFAQSSGEGYEKVRTWGVGLRMIDPMGLTIKKYFGAGALEFNFGRTLLFTGEKWEQKRFEKWMEDQSLSYYESDLIDFFTIAPISFQLHYLAQNRIDDEVQWYFGGGLNIRHNAYRFDYRHRDALATPWVTVEAGPNDAIKETDMGLDLTIGIEYTFHHIPLTLLADVIGFIELQDEPMKVWPQGGIGFRFNF